MQMRDLRTLQGDLCEDEDTATFKPPLTFLGDAPTLLKLESNTHVYEFCHGLPTLQKYQKMHTQEDVDWFHMWADANDSFEKLYSQDLSGRGTGIPDVNPHMLVVGKRNDYSQLDKDKKYISISGHQDAESLIVFDNFHGILAPGLKWFSKVYRHLTTACTLDDGQTESIDLSTFGTHSPDNEHLGAVIIHSMALHSKVMNDNATYLKIHKGNLTLERIRTDLKPIDKPILNNGDTAFIEYLAENNCEKLWALCNYWANYPFTKNWLVKKKKFYKEQSDAMVCSLDQMNSAMNWFNTYTEHSKFPQKLEESDTVYFFGDLHCSVGGLARLLLHLKDVGAIDNDTAVLKKGHILISGGDLLDRGYLGLSCVLLLYFVKHQTDMAPLLSGTGYKQHGYVGVCRGNHEDCSGPNKYAYGFRLKELEKRISKESERARQRPTCTLL